jgi:hypothetical protein
MPANYGPYSFTADQAFLEPDNIALNIPDFALLRKFFVFLAPDAIFEPVS